jgi:hypothetical protein
MKAIKLTLGLILFYSCSPLCLVLWAQEPEWVRIHNHDRTLSFVAPGDWEGRIGTYHNDLTILTPTEGKGDRMRESLRLNIEPLPVPMRPQGYWRALKRKLANSYADFQVISKQEGRVAGLPALRLVVSFYAGNLPFKNLVYVVVGRQRAYTITCSMLRDTFDTWSGPLGRVAESMAFQETKGAGPSQAAPQRKAP